MSKKGAEHFSVAIGFRNQVCCNLCTFTDGYQSDLRAMNHYNLLTGTNKSSYIDNFLDRSLNATQLTEWLSRVVQGDNEYRWFID